MSNHKKYKQKEGSAEIFIINDDGQTLIRVIDSEDYDRYRNADFEVRSLIEYLIYRDELYGKYEEVED